MDKQQVEADLAKLSQFATENKEDDEEEDDDDEGEVVTETSQQQQVVASMSLFDLVPSSSHQRGGNVGKFESLATQQQESVFHFGDMDFSDTSGSLYEPTTAGQSYASSLVTLETADYSNVEQTNVETEEVEYEDEEEVSFLDDMDEDDDIPVSYHNALVLNETYQNQLTDLLEVLQEALQENKSRQDDLSNEQRDLQAGLSVKSYEDRPKSLWKTSLTIFNAPYFKDVNLFSHPSNADTKAKRGAGELDHYIANPREWSAADKTKLTNAVRQEAIDVLMKPVLEEERKLLLQIRSAGTSAADNDLMTERMQKLMVHEEDIKSLGDDVLFKDRYFDYDWLKIAAQTFQRDVTATCCRLMWVNALHPSINKGSWSRSEDKKLKMLAVAHGKKDWDAVAEQLGTGRTGFLCCHRYRLKHAREIASNRKWTAEEDQRLKQLVQRCRIHRFIPWTKVAYYMPNGRTKDQCYQRYTYSVKERLRKGLFHELEDFVIIVGVKLFGTDWTRISDFLPSRTPVQIHSRYNTFLKANFDRWTQDEDMRLLNAVKEMGDKDWRAIAARFSRRTRSQCRTRFMYIFKTYQKSNSQFSLHQLTYSTEESLQKRKQVDVYNKLEAKVNEFLQQHRVWPQTEEVEEATEDTAEATTADDDDTDVPGKRNRSYHITPDGEKIPMAALLDFMRNLHGQLPTESHVPEPRKKDKKSRSSSTRPILPPASFKSKFTKLDRRGKVVTTYKKGIGRPFKVEVPDSRLAKVDRDLALFFRPSWPIIHGGRVRGPYHKESDLRSASTVGRFYADILQCSSSLESNCLSNSMDHQRQMSLLKALQLDGDDRAKMPPPSQVPAPKTQKVKTYSRKKNQPNSPIQEVQSKEEELKFVPPCHPSLVGLRGLLLHARRLKQCAGLEVSQGKAIQPIEEVVKSGIQNAPTTSLCAARNLEQPSSDEVQKADKLLNDRFMSLFFWPAVMSGVKPNERDDLFGLVKREDDSVAARMPYDPTDIIQEAQTRAATTPRKVIVRKAKRPKSTALKEEEAPPPPKKRILAAATKKQKS